VEGTNMSSGAGITGMALVTSFLVAGSASTVFFEDIDAISQDAEKMLNDVLQEITTYIKIDDAIGKYCGFGETRSIEKIVLFAKQYINTPINLSEIIIEISNKDDIVLLKYSGQSYEIGTSTIFQHYAWEIINNNTFSILVTDDEDRSLLDYNIMNNDLIIIIIPLSEQFKLKQSESMTISIIPENGITSSIYVETPSFHSKNIISFNNI
jgi:archaellin